MQLFMTIAGNIFHLNNSPMNFIVPKALSRIRKSASPPSTGERASKKRRKGESEQEKHKEQTGQNQKE